MKLRHRMLGFSLVIPALMAVLEADVCDFVKLTPSAITEIAHWQLQGYAVVTPVVMDKTFSIEEIR